MPYSTEIALVNSDIFIFPFLLASFLLMDHLIIIPLTIFMMFPTSYVIMRMMDSTNLLKCF